MAKKKDSAVCDGLCKHPETICLAKAELVSNLYAQQAAKLFKVLGDPTRVKMLHALIKREMCVCDLAAVVKMGQSAVSHQLRALRGARLVKYRREGKNAWYSINDKHIASLLCQGIEHIQHP
jgi:DNA-binding transcriptional ArsR family regulator